MRDAGCAYGDSIPARGPRVSPPRLSALVVAHNEEAQLADCLETLQFADELVVVLDKCTDDSKAIAARFTERLLEGSWEIEADRQHAGIDACSGDWIIHIDADERVPPELAKEIRTKIAGAPPGYFLIPFDNYVGDRLVRYGWGGSFGVSAAARLYTPGAKRWGDQAIHPKITLKGEKRRLETRIVHYHDRDISDMIKRFDRYTTVQARGLRASNDIGTFRRNFRRVFTRFFKCYVQRKGYREGYYGFLIGLFAGLMPLITHLKARLEDD
jgi:glycosyltransferase involved in cell wall biosynthesis